MAVKIRLSRIGKKNAPFYRIVAVDGRKKRDGEHLENLGTYDATGSKVVYINKEGIDNWISKGAIATDAVVRICKKHAAATQDTAELAPKVAKKVKTTKKAEAKA